MSTESRVPDVLARGIVASITIDGEALPRVELTPAAAALLDRLWDQHGPLMFHQSGGCCDGSSPMCYPQGDFITSDADVLLGELDISAVGAESVGPSAVDADRLGDVFSGSADIHEARVAPFWMSTEQFRYWRHTHLTVDVVPGRGSGFSVEAPEGVRFLIRSRLLDA